MRAWGHGMELNFLGSMPKCSKAARISGRDVALIRQSRMKSKYNELTAEERSAYESVHDSLSVLGTAVRKKLAAYGAYGMKLTSGFSIRAGVRLRFPLPPRPHASRMGGPHRGFDPEMETALEERAAREGRSVEQVIVTIVRQYLTRLTQSEGRGR